MVNNSEKHVSDVLKQKRRELERIQYEADMKRAKRTVNAMTKAIGDSTAVCKSLRGFIGDEGEIIARHIVENFDTIIQLSMDDIQAYREKKMKKKIANKKNQLAEILGKDM